MGARPTVAALIDRDAAEGTASGSPDADLHRPRRVGEVRCSRPCLSGARCAGRIAEATVIALLLTDPRQDLPRDPVPRPHAPINGEKVGGNVSLGRVRGRRVTTTARVLAEQRPEDRDAEHERAGDERGRTSGGLPGATPNGCAHARPSVAAELADEPALRAANEGEGEQVTGCAAVVDRCGGNRGPWRLAKETDADHAGATPTPSRTRTRVSTGEARAYARGDVLDAARGTAAVQERQVAAQEK